MSLLYVTFKFNFKKYKKGGGGREGIYGVWSVGYVRGHEEGEDLKKYLWEDLNRNIWPWVNFILIYISISKFVLVHIFEIIFLYF